MKSLMMTLVLVLSSSAAFALDANKINSITCTNPSTRKVNVELKRYEGTEFFSYQVDLLDTGKMSDRMDVKVTEVKKELFILSFSKDTDSDLFSYNTKTKKGWISLLFQESFPFEFEADCKVK